MNHGFSVSYSIINMAKRRNSLNCMVFIILLVMIYCSFGNVCMCVCVIVIFMYWHFKTVDFVFGWFVLNFFVCNVYTHITAYTQTSLVIWVSTSCLYYCYYYVLQLNDSWIFSVGFILNMFCQLLALFCTHACSQFSVILVLEVTLPASGNFLI